MDENEKISDEVLKSLEGKKLRCEIRDGTNLSRLRETWDIPTFKIYELHITLAALYWNKDVASLMG